jgi:hypothetical protein
MGSSPIGRAKPELSILPADNPRVCATLASQTDTGMEHLQDEEVRGRH